ncbi:MAG: ABC transporter permease [Defluviitaleaceae bacterium]|nr:ABC transporter permease [Defluviitaleaceae bacterium]
MRAVQAIFMKQLADLPKNISITIMYILFPALGLLFSTLMGGPDEYGFDQGPIMVVQFTMTFVGMVPLITIANTIAEDNEYKSLRFLVTAGVKPFQYLAGLIGFVMIMAVIVLGIFALMGGFTGTNLVIFFAFGLLGVLASSVLGAIVGIFSKNVQQCSAIYTPLMMVLAFAPFISMFSETVAQVAQFAFTFQIFAALVNLIMELPYGSEPLFDVTLIQSAIIIAVNGLIFAVLFAVAYRKKGLRG